MSRKEMEFDTFIDIMEFIDENHAFSKGKCITYVEPTIDTRTATIHCIKFFGIETKVFHIINENKDMNLEIWIMCWLLNKNYEDTLKLKKELI